MIKMLKISQLEITEVVLIHCNIANNNYQPSSWVFYTVVPNKPFGQLLDISSKSATDALKTSSKRVNQKTAEVTSDLIGNKVADRITKISKN